jgi:DNA polymerase-4
MDMDAFYAAVEALDNPDLKGRPLIVGGLGPRGVVSTASYEARAFGVHSALPTSTARRRCPQGVYLQPRHWRYKELSDQIMGIFARYTPLVEPLSLDEAFLDVGGSARLFGPAEEIARRLKDEVRAETGLTVSAGVASQKHLAKIASGLNKPDGLTIVPAGGELDFLWPLPLKDLWGVGRVMLGQLRALGLSTVGDLARFDRAWLEKRFGQSGRQLWRLANAVDEREVQAEYEAKSIGSEETFDQDLKSPEEIRAALLSQTLTAVERMRRQGYLARTVTVKFRDGRFRTRSRAKSLSRPSDLRDDLYREVLAIYEKEAPDLPPMRLLGVSLSRLSRPGAEAAPAPERRSLFDLDEPRATSPAGAEKAEKINQALDQISGRFGAGTLRPATLTGRQGRREK